MLGYPCPALEDQLNSKSGFLSRVLSVLALLALTTPALQAQTALGLPHSPISSSVLAANAYRAGLLHPQAGRAMQFPSGSLTCTNPPCVFPNLQASAGPMPVNDDPIVVNPTSASQ